MGYGGTPPETLSGALRLVKRIYAQAGLLRAGDYPPGIEWIEGERYERQEGAPPRLYFVRDRESGRLGGPLQVGAREIGSFSESLTVYAWGDETEADGDRYDAAVALLLQVQNAFVAVAAGYLTWGQVQRAQDTSLNTFGEEYGITLTYTYENPEDAAIHNALDALITADATIVSAPADPDRPNGDTGQTYAQTVISQPTRP